MQENLDQPHASIKVTRRRGVMYAEVRGEIDTGSCEQVRRDLLACLADGPAALVVDLTGVAVLGSLGIAVLIEVREHAERSRVAFAVAADHGKVVRPMHVTEVASLLGLCSTVADAVALVRRATASHHHAEFSWWSS